MSITASYSLPGPTSSPTDVSTGTKLGAISRVDVRFSSGETTVTLPILVQDGRINVPVLAYLHWMRTDQMASQRSLERHSIALQRFWAYWLAHNDEHPQSLLRGFFEALKIGHAELGWGKLQHRSAVIYFEAVNSFADWLTDDGQVFVGTSEAIHPNPKVERASGWYRKLVGFQRRLKTSMLAHLYPSSRAGRGISRHRRINPRRDPSGRISIVKHGSAAGKAMLFEEYNRLVRNEQNPRDLLLWLLLGAGALRLSESLHLYCTDISEKGREAEVVLAHPSEGMVPTVTATGKVRSVARRAYLEEHYRLLPRQELPLCNSQHAGWKGMAIEDEENLCSRIEWLLPIYGKLFWQTHLRYMMIRSRIVGPSHPYYFVNLKRNVGAPMTCEGVEGALERATERLAIRGPKNPHSLRHMYGYTSHIRFGLPLHVLQRRMRHVALESTMIYTQPTANDVRRHLEAAQKREFTTHEVRRQLEAAQNHEGLGQLTTPSS